MSGADPGKYHASRMDVPQLWKNYEMKIKALSEDSEVEWVDVVDLVPLCKGGSK